MCYRPTAIRINMGPTLVPKKPGERADMSSAAATLCAQRADSAALLQAEAAEVERRPPSAQLASAMRGRPSLATRTRTQDSARKRQFLANEESQRQALAEQTQREDTAREGHAKAQARLRERKSGDRDAAVKLNEHREATTAKRAAAIAQLQASITAAHEELRRDSKLRAEKRAAADRARAAARSEDLSDNPYLTERRRDEEQRAERERQRVHKEQAAKLAEQHSRLAAQLAWERTRRERARLAKPPAHVNGPLGGPRTLCDPSCVELG
jgi:hypothetical protein